MPADFTQAPDVLDTVVDALIALPALSNVEVVSGPLSAEPRERLEFWGIEQDEDFAGFGRTQGRPSHKDEFVLFGAVRVAQSGAGEATIRSTRSRAYALLNELSDWVRENPQLGMTDTVLMSLLERHECDQGLGDRKRWCQIKFWIRVKARI